MLGDQVYVDEGSPGVRKRISGTRDTSAPPGLGVKDFEGYTWVYRDSWKMPGGPHPRLERICRRRLA
jgi:hypothetical protein